MKFGKPDISIYVVIDFSILEMDEDRMQYYN